MRMGRIRGGLCLCAILLSAVFLQGVVESATKGTPFFQERLIFDVIPGRPQCHASTITELPGGGILAAWFAGEYEKAKDVAILSSRLPRGSAAWSEPEILNDAPGLSEGNPVLFTDAAGAVWFFYLVMYGDTWDDCRIHYRTSTDAGKTWSAEETLIKQKGYALRNRPIALAGGTTILPAANEILYTPLFILTRDNFRSIKKTGANLRAEGGLDQPAIAELPDGSVLALFRSTIPKSTIMKSLSRDGGLTWSEPVETEFPNPEAGIALTRLNDGALVLVYNNSRTARTPISAALSVDGGETWPWRRDIESGPCEFSYPCVIQTADGFIHVTYTWKRTNIKHVVFNREWIEGASGTEE